MQKIAIILGLLVIGILIFGCTTIQQTACVTNWACGEWSSCYSNSTQTRQCADLNKCGNITGKPVETQACTFCGNGILESGENKDTCCKDAGCPQGYNCTNNVCVQFKPKPVCGNNIFEEGETSETCCKDVGCQTGFICQNNICIAKTTTTKEPSQLIINMLDLPLGKNWTLQSREERTKSDVAKSGLELGWKTGYHILFYNLVSYSEYTSIENDMSIYPPENITILWNAASLTREYFLNLSKTNQSIQFDDLTDPKLGDRSRAYRVKDLEKNVVYYYIEFTRLDVYEHLGMWGPVTDYELLKELARKVEAKIE